MAAPHVVDEPVHFSDEELVDRLRAGDQTAFEEVYQRYFPRIYSYVDKRLRNRADTEETVQEVFISIFSSIESYRGEAPFIAWAFGLTRRTIASRFKKKRHTTVPLITEEQEHSVTQTSAFGTLRGGPNPLETYECRERISQLERLATTRLSDEQRTLFQLHHLQNQSISEIAIALEKSEDSIKSNLYRARRILLAR